MSERSEVAFLERLVVGRERIEAFNRFPNRRMILERTVVARVEFLEWTGGTICATRGYRDCGRMRPQWTCGESDD